ncbi:MAG: COG1361 S-layer family protein [Candidatus Woesearchaeota archaeon]
MEEKMKYNIYLVFVLMTFSIFYSAGMVLAASTGSADTLNVMLLNQDPDPAEPGKYVELRWKVTKDTIGVLDKATFELKPEYPLSIDASETIVKEITDIGSTGNDDYYILYYKVYVDPDAIEGDYDLDLSIGINSIITHKLFTIRVADGGNPELTTGIIRTEPSKLMPDSTDNKLSVELLNIGEDDAELVTAKLSLPIGFESTYSYSSISSLGTITGGSSKTAIFYIDADGNVSEKAYPALITLTYREEDETILMTKELPIQLEVKNKPMFHITGITYDPAVVYAGDTVTMKVSIMNIGSKDSESVSLRAFKESSQPFDFDEKSDFIGTLEPMQEGTAVIVFSVGKDAASKEYLMDLEIRSIYNGDVFTQQDVANVDILAKKSGFLSRYWIAIVVVITAILLVGYFTVKKK